MNQWFYLFNKADSMFRDMIRNMSEYELKDLIRSMEKKK